MGKLSYITDQKIALVDSSGLDLKSYRTVGRFIRNRHERLVDLPAFDLNHFVILGSRRKRLKPV